MFCSRISYGYLRFKLLSRCTCFGYMKKPQVLRRLHAPIALLLVAVCFYCCCYSSVHLFLSFFPTFLSFASFRYSFFFVLVIHLFHFGILSMPMGWHQVVEEKRMQFKGWRKKGENNWTEDAVHLKAQVEWRKRKKTWNLVCWVLLFAGSKCRQKN